MPAENDPDLNAAYALQSPDDNRKLYADWAQTYDDGFAADMDYRLPQIVALVLSEVFDGDGPVLDVGAGTGLVAEHVVPRGAFEIDALDISPDMLAVAAHKGLYRQTIVADLTQELGIVPGSYAAVVSSGTFTHGHVGPDALDPLLEVAQCGACFVLSINAEHYEARGFAAKFAALAPVIEGFEQRSVRIYGDGAYVAHREDRAQIAVFYKR